MGSFNVQMPDGTTKQVQGTTLAAAINNAGPGAAAPGSGGGGGGGSVSVQSAPAPSSGGGGTYNPQGSTAAMNAAGFADTPAGRAAQASGQAGTPGPTSGLVGAQPSSSLGNTPSTTSNDAALLGQIANQMQQALAAGNKAAFDEAVREYNQNFGLDTQKFQASVDQFNQTQAQNVGALTGTFQGAPTLAAQKQTADIAAQQAATGLAQQTQNQTAANQYLTLIAGLRGPNDPVQYLRTLQGTPQGLKDIVNAAAGRYQLGGAPSGEQAAAATVGGQLANMNATQGGANPLDPLAQALPPANQIDSRAYNAMLPSQKAGLWSIYEYGGPSGAMNPADAQTMYANSLPKYGGPQTGGFLSPASGGAARSF